ncbi:MAG: restriction endonuclease [Paraglaciecola chathamensis]
MAKKNTSFFNLLTQAPWWVTAAVAAITYVFLVMILPNIQTGNPIITAIFIALSQAAPFFFGGFLLAAPFAYLNSRRKRKLLELQQDIDSIKALSWKEFEELVAEAYRRQGFRVIENGFGPDGGVDVKLSKNKQTTLVQCKQWKSKNVGVAVIREMFGILTAENASKVVIICCGGFTREASNFAENKPIELIGGTELLRIVKDIQNNSASNVESPTKHMPLESRQQLEPSPIINQSPCPKCGNQLVRRQAKRGANLGNTFLGCSSFPKCRYTKDMQINAHE